MAEIDGGPGMFYDGGDGLKTKMVVVCGGWYVVVVLRVVDDGEGGGLVVAGIDEVKDASKGRVCGGRFGGRFGGEHSVVTVGATAWMAATPAKAAHSVEASCSLFSGVMGRELIMMAVQFKCEAQSELQHGFPPVDLMGKALIQKIHLLGQYRAGATTSTIKMPTSAFRLHIVDFIGQAQYTMVQKTYSQFTQHGLKFCSSNQTCNSRIGN